MLSCLVSVTCVDQLLCIRSFLFSRDNEVLANRRQSRLTYSDTILLHSLWLSMVIMLVSNNNNADSIVFAIMFMSLTSSV